MTINNYKNLEVWQLSIQLVSDVYKATESFPDVEKFGPTNQTRRSAVSIPSNIAEGSGRWSEKEFSRFLNIANGSLLELETQLIISSNLKFLQNDLLENFKSQIERIGKMIFKLKKSINTEKTIND